MESPKGMILQGLPSVGQGLYATGAAPALPSGRSPLSTPEAPPAAGSDVTPDSEHPTSIHAPATNVPNAVAIRERDIGPDIYHHGSPLRRCDHHDPVPHPSSVGPNEFRGASRHKKPVAYASFGRSVPRSAVRRELSRALGFCGTFSLPPCG